MFQYFIIFGSLDTPMNFHHLTWENFIGYNYQKDFESYFKAILKIWKHIFYVIKHHCWKISFINFNPT